MKTAIDIQKTFKAKTVSRGSKNVYKCTVSINGAFICEGLGSTMEKAEDTAFYGTLITLRD